MLRWKRSRKWAKEDKIHDGKNRKRDRRDCKKN